MLGVSLWTDFYMICKYQVSVTAVVIINPTWDMVAMSVISWLVGAIAKFNTTSVNLMHNAPCRSPPPGPSHFPLRF